jgi:hypothetical protein
LYEYAADARGSEGMFIGRCDIMVDSATPAP